MRGRPGKSSKTQPSLKHHKPTYAIDVAMSFMYDIVLCTVVTMSLLSRLTCIASYVAMLF